MRRFVTPCGHTVTLVLPRSQCDHRVSQSAASHIIDHTIAVSYITMYTTFITHHMLTSHITQCHPVTPRCLPVPGDVAPFRCGTAPGLCVSTCMLVVGGRHRGRTLCIWHPLGVGGLQPLRSAIGAAQSYSRESERMTRSFAPSWADSALRDSEMTQIDTWNYFCWTWKRHRGSSE